jgi:zinc protease
MPETLKFLAALAVLALGVRTFAWADAGKPASTKVFPYEVQQTTLDNGLKIMAVPFDSPGLVAYWTIVRTGSRNEVEPGKSGFAHFFEHMMFRGTDRYPREKYNAVLKELGADHNAFTSDDLTAYHVLGPASGLETIMMVEADRFRNLKYSVEDFKKEAGSVLGEYNKSASNPLLIMHEQLRDLAFTTHTYKHTTIGFLQDIKDMPNQYEYSLQFFDRYYRPENCILLVVGDVDAKKLVTLAKKHYGGWPRGSFKFEAAVEPPQTVEKRTESSWPVPTLPYLFVGYKSPAFSTENRDMPALDIISQLLFSDAAPLYQRLVVEEQEVDALSGGAPDHRDPYLFTILARVKKDDRVPYVEETITAEIRALQETPVEAARLEKVKSHLKYSFATGLDTANSVARQLAHFLALTGDPESINRLFDQYDKVTPADVQAAARTFLVPSGKTAVALYHRPEPPASGEASEPSGNSR